MKFYKNIIALFAFVAIMAMGGNAWGQVISCSGSGYDCVQCGASTYSSNEYGPVSRTSSNYSKYYSYHQIIYKASELCENGGKINAIAFMANGAGPTVSIDIYMKNTTRTSFTSDTDWETSDLTLVYSGTVTFSDGWNTIILDTPFDYEGGNKNLLVSIDNNTGITSNPKFYYSTVTSNSCIARRATSDISISSPGYASARYGYRPNTAFCIKCNAACTDPGTFAFSDDSETILVGNTYDITAGSNLTIPGVAGSVSYVSSDASVATVDASGVVTGVAEGSATITATFTPDDASYCTKTATYTVTVTDGCTQVGSGTKKGHLAPIYIATGSTARYSYTQQLYLASEVLSSGGNAGTIQHLKFQYYGTSDLTLPIEIYLGQTTSSSLSDGWISDASLTLVYTGSPTFSQGWVDITIADYSWDGSRNILLAVKTKESTVSASNNDFYYTEISNLSRYTNPTSEAELNGTMCPSQSGSATNNRPNVRFCISPCTTIEGTFSLSTTSSSKAIGETVNLASGAGILTNSVTTPGTLSFSSSIPSIASVTSAGLVTALQSGTAEITVTYTPTSSAYCTTNLVYTITVTDDCTQVGSATKTDNYVTPIRSSESTYYSYTQQIYTAAEITAAGGLEGLVESVKFHYYGDADQRTFEDLPIELYMGLTTQTALEDGLEGWISDANLVQVFSGSKTFAPGWVDIDISSAGFNWDAESNILVALRTTGSLSSAQGKFYYTEVAGGAKHTSMASLVAIDPTTKVPTSASGTITTKRPEIKFCIDACTSRVSTLAFSQDTIRIVSGDSFSVPTLDGSVAPSGTITYASSNSDVALITNSSTGALTMTGNSGTAVITASVPYETIEGVYYCAAKAQYVIEVSCLEPIVSISSTSDTLAPEATVDLDVVSTSNGGVTWNSSNTAIATVDSDGIVTAVSEGHCVVTATIAAVGAYCEAQVTCNVHVSTDDCTRVGWSSSTIASIGAYSNSYRYSYTQQLYSATEIRMAGGLAGVITSIKVRHKGSASVVSEIYMAMTTQDNLEDDYVRLGFIPVFANTINYVDGWTEIVLTTPFQWDGESNIVVAFNNDRGTTTIDSNNGCIVHTAYWNYNNSTEHAYKYRYYQVDASYIELTSYLPSDYTNKSDNRNDIKFCIDECSNSVDAYFSASNLTVALSGGNVATSLTVNPDSGPGAVTYLSDNESVATVNSTTGVITPVAEGNATIIASVAANGNYCAATAYLDVTVCNCPVAGDEMYQMGSQTQTEYTCAPVDNTENYGYRQIIYPSDMLTPGTIHSIAFNYAYESYALTEKNNVVIYMANTSKTEFTSKTDWVTSGLMEVYRGPLDCTYGWNKFDLSTPFEYNGCDNLLVAIDDNSNSYNSQDGANRDYYKFYTSTSANNVIIYYNDNDTDAVPANPPQANYFTNHYPDVKFCIMPSASVTGHEHTLSYDLGTNCTGDGVTYSPVSIASVTASYAEVTSVVPSCTKYAGFKEWNTASDGSGTAYHAGDRVNISCNDVTLYAIYNNEVQGESSCENAVAFCNSDNSISFAVSEGYGETYGDFCAYFNSPGTWWYMQIAEAGDLYMTIASSAGDVDMACWGPFDNMTCDLADLSDNGANGWYTYSNASYHYSNTDVDPSGPNYSTPICEANTLASPSGNLVDYGGTTSAVEYLQIVGAQPGDYYMILVANYANTDGTITFTQTGGSGRASCDIVSNCAITSISAETECTSSNSYKVSGYIAFRDAPVDGTLEVTLGGDTLTFNPPFTSPTAYSFEGLTPNGSSTTITASFSSSTLNCSKISSFTAPSKSYCEDVVLPITLVSLRGECNGKRALISWTTASERNNNYFVVERSDDAVNFVEVGRVAGAGNSMQMLSYSYADYGISLGDNYYRLVQVDYDGTRTISEIIEVNCSGNAPEGDPDVYVYPNPFNNELTVHLVNFDDQPARIQVYDMLGRLLFERSASPTYNNAEIVLHLDGLPRAAYYVRVSASDFVVNRKVVKNN